MVWFTGLNHQRHIFLCLWPHFVVTNVIQPYFKHLLHGQIVAMFFFYACFFPQKIILYPLFSLIEMCTGGNKQVYETKEWKPYMKTHFKALFLPHTHSWDNGLNALCLSVLFAQLLSQLMMQFWFLTFVVRLLRSVKSFSTSFQFKYSAIFKQKDSGGGGDGAVNLCQEWEHSFSLNI